MRVVVAGMRMPPNFGQEYTASFEGMYPALVQANPGATLIPFLLEGVGGIPAYNQADGIHPTAEGHKIRRRPRVEGARAARETVTPAAAHGFGFADARTVSAGLPFAGAGRVMEKPQHGEDERQAGEQEDQREAAQRAGDLHGDEAVSGGASAAEELAERPQKAFRERVRVGRLLRLVLVRRGLARRDRLAAGSQDLAPVRRADDPGHAADGQVDSVAEVPAASQPSVASSLEKEHTRTRLIGSGG